MPLKGFLRRSPRNGSPAPPSSVEASPERIVELCYWVILGRAPDTHSREHVKRLAQNQPLESVVRALLSSLEFRCRHFDLTAGSTTESVLAPIEPHLAALGSDAAFLESCYHLLLGRAPDPPGLEWHSAELARGVRRSTAVWTMLNSDEFASRYHALAPDRGEVPCDIQLCELANPAKWDNPDWLAVLKELRLPAEHKLSMHRKAYEFTQTIWGLQRLRALTDSASVLSVGAGHEAPAYWLANRVAHVVATDLYQGAWQTEGALEGDIDVVSNARAFAPFEYRRNRLRFLQMDGTALAFRDGVFDIAYSLSSIEHFGGWPGARRAVEEMARVVRPGGVVVVATEWAVSGPPLQEVFQPDEVHRLLDLPGLQLVEPIDDRVWQRYHAVPVDVRRNCFETPHMLISLDGTVFTSVIVFLRRV